MSFGAAAADESDGIILEPALFESSLKPEANKLAPQS